MECSAELFERLGSTDQARYTFSAKFDRGQLRCLTSEPVGTTVTNMNMNGGDNIFSFRRLLYNALSGAREKCEACPAD